MISFLVTHPYFTSTLILIPFWVTLFITRKESRAEMLTMGKYLGLCGFILSSTSLRDYWHPAFIFGPFHMEEILYGFLFGGVCVEVAKIFFKEKYRHHPRRLSFLFFTIIISYVMLKVGITYLQINSIYIYCIVLVFMGLACYTLDRKILPLQLTSGLLALILTFTVFKIALLVSPNFIHDTWKLENISGVLFSGIPLEEYIFAFLLGFGGSSYYETYEGIDVTSTKLRFT
ncbi:MAG: lycopene cyclase domain-containing protein [Candidatus Paceibacterota bacterium]